MVNQDLMWENIREELAKNHSPEVVQLLKKYVLLMPLAFRGDILESLVTIEDLLRARIACDEYLSATQLAIEFARVESRYPSPGYGDNYSPSTADLEKFVTHRLQIQTAQAQGYIDELQYRRNTDNKYLRKSHPSWSIEQQLLYYAGVRTDLIAMHQEGKLTFAMLLEASPSIFFVNLGR